MNTTTAPQPIQRQLLAGLFWVLLANLIVKPFWLLGIEVGVQNAVGNEAYGLYFAIFNTAYIFNILLDLGLTNFNTRTIAQTPGLISRYLGGILTLKLLLLGLYLVVTFSVALVLGYGSTEFRLLAWLCLAQGLNSLILYLRSNLEGLLLFRWDSLFSVLDRLLMCVICGYMLWGHPVASASGSISIFHFVYAQVAAYAASAALAAVVVVRHARKTSQSPLAFRWRRGFLRLVLRRSAPFALLVLLMATYNRLDPILLRRIATDAEAGIYAGAFRLLDALTMIAYLVSIPLLPVFSRLCAPGTLRRGGTSGELVSTIRLVLWPLLLFAVGSAVACIWAAPSLMEMLYPQRGELYVRTFRILIAGIIPISLTYIFGTLLTAAGRLRHLNLCAAATLLLNLILNLLLIPHLGAAGSACASLAAQSLMAAAQIWIAIRLCSLPRSTFAPPHLADIRALIGILRSKTQPIK